MIQAQNGANFTADATCQAELTAFWMSRKMGLLSGHKRHVHLFFNGVRRAIIYEDAEQPNSLVVEQHLRSQKDGTLYKIEDWFEFDDAGAAHNHQNANLPATTTTINGVPGQKKMARYRNNWRIRGQADPNEYTPIFDLVDAVNAANTPTDTAFVAGMNNLVDMENWLGTILAHHIVGTGMPMVTSGARTVMLSNPTMVNGCNSPGTWTLRSERSPAKLAQTSLQRIQMEPMQTVANLKLRSCSTHQHSVGNTSPPPAERPWGR